MTIKELNAKIKELTEKMTALQGGDEDDKSEAIKELSDQLSALAEQAEAMEEADAGSATVRELAESKARIVKLEADARARETAERTAALRIPSLRPQVAALYTYALEHPEAQVKVFSKDSAGKDVTTEKTLAQVVDSCVTELNSQADKLFKGLAVVDNGLRLHRQEADTEEETAGDEVHKRVKKYQGDHPTVKSYSEAQAHVLAADPALNTRYAEELRSSAAARVGG